MKVKIGDYQVNITAKNDTLKSRKDTLRFLNTLAIVFNEAAELNDKEGYKAVAAEYEEIWRDVHAFLDAKGLYNKSR